MAMINFFIILSTLIIMIDIRLINKQSQYFIDKFREKFSNDLDYYQSKFQLSQLSQLSMLIKIVSLISKLPKNNLCFVTIKNKSDIIRKPNTIVQPSVPSVTKQKAMNVYQSHPDLQLAKQVIKLPLKQFSVKIHHLLVNKEKSSLFWSTVESSFLQILKPTTDPIVIRSYAKIIYTLSKSKQATGNYQTNIGLLLPFATPPSFVSMVTAASRIAPLSAEFTYIVQKFYYKRKSEFNARELVSINYSLANNGRPCDTGLIEHIDSFNCVQTITMLRCYDLSNSITPELLKTTLKKLKAIQNQFNVLDLSDFISIYLKYKFTGEGFEQMVEDSYRTLKRNVNEVCLEKIWGYMPSAVNEGRVRIKFVEQVIGTMLILRKGRNMGEVVWRRVQATFKEVQNIELKVRLEKIY